jgi:hypothetical protein
MLLRDLGARAVQTTSTKLADLTAVRRARQRAAAHWRAGRGDEAILEYGRLIRDVQHARESLRTYDRIAEWIAAGAAAPEGLRLGTGPPDRFVFFVGYSRSGHSLVGSLLDAHPDVAISHELHAARHLRAGADFARVQRAILLNAFFFDHFGRGYSGYDYEVPGQMQGRVERLRILGDKKANGTTRLLRRDAGLAARLRERIPAPVHWLHVVRNPFDNIATKARRASTSLRWAADVYLAHVAAVEQLKQDEGDAVIDVFLDDLIADPRRQLSGLLARLGVDELPADYLDACSGRLFDRPKQTRSQMRWSPDLLRDVRARLRDCEFLARFADEPVAE